MINLRILLRSFRHAFAGIAVVFRTEQSFRLQTCAALIVIVFSTWVRVTSIELVILLMMIACVLVLELINSVFERIVDTSKPRIHPMVGEIKDIMAGAVLLSSLVAVGVGAVILAPYLVVLVQPSF